MPKTELASNNQTARSPAAVREAITDLIVNTVSGFHHEHAQVHARVDLIGSHDERFLSPQQTCARHLHVPMVVLAMRSRTEHIRARVPWELMAPIVKMVRIYFGVFLCYFILVLCSPAN